MDINKLFLGKPNHIILKCIRQLHSEFFVSFKGLEDNSTISIKMSDGSLIPYNFEISKDGTDTWTKLNDLADAYSGEKIYLNACENSTLYIRAPENLPNANGFYDNTTKAYLKFVINEGSVEAVGNIQCLLEYLGQRTDAPDYCYYHMFDSCTSLVSAPMLTALKIGLHCYDSMFYNCTSLTNAPKILATTLENQCCMDMFKMPTSSGIPVDSALTAATDLLAERANYQCYQSMFDGCKNLIVPPRLFATSLGGNCYLNIIRFCNNITEIHMRAGVSYSASVNGDMNSKRETDLTVIYDL